MANLTFTPPADGAAVTMQNGRLCVPDRPVIPFIIGDGTFFTFFSDFFQKARKPFISLTSCMH